MTFNGNDNHDGEYTHEMTGPTLCLSFKHQLFVVSKPEEHQLRRVTENVFPHN